MAACASHVPRDILEKSMWGYATADQTALTIVVGVIVIAAIAYLIRRYLGGKR